MLKVIVTNTKDGRQFQAEFATQAEADAWIALNKQNESWGKVSRWLPEDRLEGEDITQAIANELRGDPPIDGQPDLRKRWYQFPDQFTVSVVDVTAEVTKRKTIEYANKAQSFGAQLLTEIFQLNESKNLLPAQFDALLADPNLEKIERCLWNGSLAKARDLISLLDETYYTLAEKTEIINKINNFLSSNGRV